MSLPQDLEIKVNNGLQHSRFFSDPCTTVVNR